MPLPSLHSPTKRSRRAPRSKAPIKRRLFEAEQESGREASSCPLPVAPPPEEPELEVQDSACSTITALYIASEDGVAAGGPPTPEQRGRRAPPLQPAALCKSLELPLAYTLQAWRNQLVRLQPLVRLGDEVLLGALAVVRGLAAARPDLAPILDASVPHVYAYLAAALWMCAKLCGVRTSIPNRSLMSQATSVDPQALTDYEMDLLQSLDWDVAGLLAQQGLLC
ncbi:hypothetical protein C2E20_3151 [Micractinium conductrix]|uniref:Uncharacterized protein n=1 Tax=Micractinium conductrix TaxID=554055 RepID=A0A2P6VIM6_9CHLO|nr:hypothetical protein C2E20_3151 [Micractinium conductrix]|eukprot:PSC73944.1 hypothetical protein C2E20_3151 [Micractinium conductrix]